MPVFYRYYAGINLVLCRSFSSVLLVFIPDPVSGFYRKSPGVLDRTENIFHRSSPLKSGFLMAEHHNRLVTNMRVCKLFTEHKHELDFGIDI